MFHDAFVAKACVLMPQNRKFIGCDLEHSCVAESVLQLVLTYERHALNPESILKAKSDEVVDAARHM